MEAQTLTNTHLPTTQIAKPYRVHFMTGGRQWYATLEDAKRASKQGTRGIIAVWSGRAWIEE
jgi:hypothetical protein